jgi:hypothetical protein
MGIGLPFPLVACTPRRWQVAINKFTYDARKWVVMVTRERSGRTCPRIFPNFLMKLKM